MPKKSNKKKDRILRREIEMLRAQMSVTKPIENIKDTSSSTESKGTSKSKTQELIVTSVDHENIKQDLLRSLTLAIFGFGVIAVLWAYENQLLPRLNF